MYKETVQRKVFQVIFALFFILVITLFFVEAIKVMYVQRYDVNNFLNLIFQVGLLGVFIFELLKCKIRYSYSIIADQFIIHKLTGNEDKLVENIKIRDIEFIGKSSKLIGNLNSITSKNYICSLFCKEPYCCIYKNGDKLNKFYFEPSSDLVNKLIIIKNKRLGV